MSEIMIVKEGDFVEGSSLGSKPLIKIYEVIRLMKSCPIFLEDHLDRMFRSADVSGIKLWLKKDQISNALFELICANEQTEGNIKFEFEFSPLENRSRFMARFIPHSYPNSMDYSKGVKMINMPSLRPNPNAKVENLTIRDQADQLIRSNGLFDVLLVDPDGNLTEGSRSNVFFIKDSCVYSAPESDILLGITYLKVVEFCRKNEIELVNKKISLHDLSEFSSAFVTGTSPMVLPIRNIDDHQFTVRSLVLQDIMKGYQQMLAEYIKQYHERSR